MGVQKFRFDRDGDPETNGSIPVYTDWMAGPSLAGVRNCPCSDGSVRTVYVQDDADTLFSMPASCVIRRKRYKGSLTVKTIDGLDTGDRAGYFFDLYRT